MIAEIELAKTNLPYEAHADFVAPVEYNPRYRQVRIWSRLLGCHAVVWVNPTSRREMEIHNAAFICTCPGGNDYAESSIAAIFADPRATRRRIRDAVYVVCACNGPQWIE